MPVVEAAPARVGTQVWEPRAYQRVAERGIRLVDRDIDVVCWLAQMRYATSYQVMRRCWPRNQMPVRQTANKLLRRLQRLGLVEQHRILKGVVVYQPTRAGYDLAEDAGLVTKNLSTPAVGTLKHTLQVNDLLIEWECGRGRLPDGFARPVTVIAEREITAVDKAPIKVVGRKRSGVKQYAAGGEELVSTADEPVYGYRLHKNGQWTRGFPDAVLMPAGWTRGEPVRGAIAVEVELTDKEPADYRTLLRAYDRERRAGKYAYLFYVSNRQSYLDKVKKAATDIGIPKGFLRTAMVSEPLWGTQPQRTTPEHPKRPPPDAPVETQLLRLPKAHLVGAMVHLGVAEKVLAAARATPQAEAAVGDHP